MDIKIIKGVVEHNGKPYGIDDEIKQMKRPDGERLVRLGMAEELVKEVNSSGKGKDKNTGSEDNSDSGSDDGSGKDKTPS